MANDLPQNGSGEHTHVIIIGAGEAPIAVLPNISIVKGIR